MSQWCSWRFLVWYSFLVRVYTDSREVKGENDWEGGERGGGGREREENSHCFLSSPPPPSISGSTSAFARLHLLLYEPQRKEQKKPPATQALSALRRESLSYSREIYNQVHRK